MAVASGVMVYVSLVEVLHESKEKFEKSFELESYGGSLEPGQVAVCFALLSFIGGWILAVAMDKALNHFMDWKSECDECIPLSGKPLGKCDEDGQAQSKFEADTYRLVKVGWFTALALALHNIPEGLLTYVSAQTEEVGVGLGFACAIGLHNIPDGVAVAMPIFVGTNSKKKAMLYAAITGLAEPLGAAIGWMIFTAAGFQTESAVSLKTYGFLFGLTAGIMVEVAIKSLLYEAIRYDPTDKVVSWAWLFGAVLIAISLIIIDITAPANCGQLFNSTVSSLQVEFESSAQ